MVSEQYFPQVLRHGLKHHLYDCLGRGDIVFQYPFTGHTDRTHTIETNIVGKLGINDIGVQLFFYQVCITADGYLQTTEGCSHNTCLFCTCFKDQKFRKSSIEEIEEDIKEIPSVFSAPERIFLQGGRTAMRQIMMY